MTEQIVLASNNAGKLAELNSLFLTYNVEVISQSLLGVSEAEETGLSFIENAILKARHASQATNLPALADDSGLEVLALNGRPGIYSARFAGKDSNDQKNNQHLLNMLKDVVDSKRQANFRCVMAYVRQANDSSPIVAEGVFHGKILTTPQGQNGFGYDPLFYIPELNKSCAELTSEQKNRISHRALACQELIGKLIANQIINA